MKKITQEDVDKAWKVWDEARKDWEDLKAWEKALELGRKFKEQERELTEVKCEHTWVYDNCLLLSEPPQRDRICSKCGEMGRVTMGIPIPYEDTYPAIVKKFKEQEGLR